MLRNTLETAIRLAAGFAERKAAPLVPYPEVSKLQPDGLYSSKLWIGRGYEGPDGNVNSVIAQDDRRLRPIKPISAVGITIQFRDR
jgi:hypothetical protein